MKRTHLTQTVNHVKTEIAISDIDVFMSEDKYTNAHMNAGQVYLIDDPKTNAIINLIEEFGDEFIVVKRGCLVRKSEITNVKRLCGGGYHAYLKSGAFVVVSRREVPVVRRMIHERDDAARLEMLKALIAKEPDDAIISAGVNARDPVY